MQALFGGSVLMYLLKYLLNQSGDTLNLNSIGMPTDMLERFRAILQRPNGLVLVTGPTVSGKTITLYGALSELNTLEWKVVTAEDPVEDWLPGINQVQSSTRSHWRLPRSQGPHCSRIRSRPS